MKRRLVIGCACLMAAGACVDSDQAEDQAAGRSRVEANSAVRPPQGLAAGSNEMLRATLAAAPDLEVLVSDVVIPPDTEVPRHYHPGEEFVYVIEGTAVHVEAGKPDRLLQAGDAMVIEPEAVHAPRGGPNGARAIVFRVHVAGRPERVAVPDPAGT